MRSAGVVECFPKPFAMDGLRRSVARAIEARAESQRRRARSSR
jgi:DNA-binding NtrC family response regulator